MRSLFGSFFLLPLLFIFSAYAPSARSAALTTVLSAQERACFYAWVDKQGEKVGFYFAVQSGGSFDIDYTVASPADKIIIEGTKERQLDIIFTGNEIGEYAFCFENDMSTFAEKLVSTATTSASAPTCRVKRRLDGAEILEKHLALVVQGDQSDAFAHAFAG